LKQGANQKRANFIPNSESTWFEFSLKLAIAPLGTEDCFASLTFSGSWWMPLMRIS